MIIEKNGIIYAVTETAKEWKLSADRNGVKIIFKVSKKDCSTFEKLKNLILKEL